MMDIRYTSLIAILAIFYSSPSFGGIDDSIKYIENHLEIKQKVSLENQCSMKLIYKNDRYTDTVQINLGAVKNIRRLAPGGGGGGGLDITTENNGVRFNIVEGVKNSERISQGALLSFKGDSEAFFQHFTEILNSCARGYSVADERRPASSSGTAISVGDSVFVCAARSTCSAVVELVGADRIKVEFTDFCDAGLVTNFLSGQREWIPRGNVKKNRNSCK